MSIPDIGDISSEVLSIYSKLDVSDANEAETRLKIIDLIIFKILGWGFDDVKVEERVSEDGRTTFADYVIKTANTGIIIEAKKTGASFDLPKRLNQFKARLSGKILEGDLGAAIIQARDYCRKLSIQFAVVTNGNTWIIFPAIRTDKVEFSQSNAIIFLTLSEILGQKRDYFFSLLSRDGVIDGNLDRELLGTIEDQVNERRLCSFFNADVARNKNPIFPLIEQAVHIAFSDNISSSDSQILELCYVKNPLDIKFDSRIKMYIQKASSLFSSSPIKPMSKKDHNSLSKIISSIKVGEKSLAMLILGSVGSGKTTFIEYTRKISSVEFFKKDDTHPYNHWINVDFRNFSERACSYDFIYESILNYLNDDLYFSNYDRGIISAYQSEIDSLKRGPMFLIAKDSKLFDEKITNIITNDYEGKSPYVTKLLKAATKKCAVFLVIDNVDQVDDIDIAKKIFADAMALAQAVGLNLVMAMRESTYVTHRHSPTFDAFDFDPIQIDPPDLKSVLSRRFFLTSQLLKGQKGDFKAPNGANFHVEDLSEFVEIVQKSVLGTNVGERIEVLAQNDIRLALRMTREFLERGYTDPASAINKSRLGQNYTLPKHEALRAILIGNNPVYNEKLSAIGNPLDSRLNKTNAQMLRLFIMSALFRMSSEKSTGYIDGVDIRKNLREIGFSDDLTIKVLVDLCRLRFIQTHSHQEATFDSSFFLTRLGGHMIKDLLSDMSFLENIMMDTFITDDVVWNRIYRLSADISIQKDVVRKIEIRIKRLIIFWQYIHRIYQVILEQARLRVLKREWLGDPISDLKENFLLSLRKAKISAYRHYRGIDISRNNAVFPYIKSDDT